MYFNSLLQWDSAFDHRASMRTANQLTSSKVQQSVVVESAPTAAAVAPPPPLPTAVAPAAAVITPGAPAADGKGGKKRPCSLL
jgi:hypothetical protein